MPMRVELQHHRHSAKTTMSALRFAFRTAIPRVALASARVQTRFVLPRATYASSAGLSKDDIQKRVLDVLKDFERVDQTKVRVSSITICIRSLTAEQLTPTAAFAEDLGLDSLDAVEVVMAVEEVRI